ncbi:MAG: ankyrin repeat domain-containing protein [Gallionella sp.]|nr:ankyrin repeat domain-containing protein [Gallionella sp.]
MSVFKSLVVTGGILLSFASSSAFAAKYNAIEKPMAPPSKATEMFFKAASNANFEMMGTYLARGADINCGNCESMGRPPLAVALAGGGGFAINIDLVKYLVQHGANVNLFTQGVLSPLMFAISSREWAYFAGKPEHLVETITYLVDNGADVKLTNSDGQNALFALVAHGYNQHSANASLRLMRFLVDNGTDVNYQSVDGRTALMVAAGGCGIDSVKLFLFLKANPNLKNKMGETALSLAEDAAAKSQSGSSCNQVVAMLRNPSQFAINPLSNADVIVTAQSARSAGAATAAVGNVAPALSAYAGNYNGNYNGDDQGAFQVAISQEGNITLSGKSLRSNQAFTGSGKIGEDGLLGVTLGNISSGATFQGSINPTTGAMYGTWKNSGQAGNFSGNKQAQLDNPLNAIGGLLNGLGKILVH